MSITITLAPEDLTSFMDTLRADKLEVHCIAARCNDYADQVADLKADKADLQSKLSQAMGQGYGQQDHTQAVKTLMSAVLNGEKIQAIRQVRAILGTGLKESKDIVDEICGSVMRPVPPPIHLPPAETRVIPRPEEGTLSDFDPNTYLDKLRSNLMTFANQTRSRSLGNG